jgi:hypothetical protein
MAGISDVVSVSVAAAARNPSVTGFGRTLLLGYHTKFTETFRIYKSPDAMVSDGFATSDPLYKMAGAIFGQTSRPRDVMVGRLPAAHTHTQTVTITNATEGEHVKLTLTLDGTATEIDYTIPAAATLTSVATAVEALIEAVTGVASAPSVDVITVTPVTAGKVIYITDCLNCTVEDATADAGYDDQAAQIKIDSSGQGGFFFWAIDTNSEANIDLCVTWANTNKKPFMYQVQDYTEKAGTGALFSGVAATATDFAFGVHTDRPDTYPNCAAAGFSGGKQPGAYTLALKELPGVATSTYTDSQESNLRAVNANYYTTLADLPILLGSDNGGVCASGEFLDIVHGREAFLSDLQVAVFIAMRAGDKTDYSDEGTDLLVGAMRSVQARYEGKGKLFKEGTTWARAEPAEDMLAADVLSRHFPGLLFGGEYNGAIQSSGLTGTLTA